jgi:hypothetical protein
MSDDDSARFRHEFAARRDAYRWSNAPDACPLCGERIGHFGGSTERDPCKQIPQDVPLVEVRPNCYAVRRHRIGAAIRVACEARATRDA